MKKKMVIEIENGLVTKVLTNVQLDNVVVVDRDNQDQGMEQFIDYPFVVEYEYDDLYLYYATDCTRDQEIMDKLKTRKI